MLPDEDTHPNQSVESDDTAKTIVGVNRGRETPFLSQETHGDNRTLDDEPADGRDTVILSGSQNTWRRRRFPVENWSKYDFIRVLGQGGMGTVFEARDTRLGRVVALKFLNGENDALAERFIREARAQSRIEHPNVCKVYEVGEVEGHPYIAMQCVNGRPLGEARSEMSLEERVSVVLDVAAALHAAHRLGIIHRDIKPSNILVEKTSEGNWKPTVMDFGLAREVGNDGMTESGVVLGTPAFMSPEQARGDNRDLDRRTDVYSLGATLFELLTGRPPFTASSGLALMLKVIEQDAPSLRSVAPHLPPDLDTIVGRCLEKEPVRRYDSAAALAADLQAFLDGVPIMARQTTWHYRLVQKARKHRTLVAVVAVAALLLLALGGVAIRNAVLAQRMETLARQFGEDAYRIEANVRAMNLAPPHDTRTERTKIRAVLDRIRDRMKSAGRIADGPGSYALGRGSLAFGDLDPAIESLARSRAAGFRSPGLDYAQGRALGEAFRRELSEAERLPNRDVREARMKVLERTLLRPALEYLDAYARSGEASQLEDAGYVQGLIAFYRHDYPTALARAAEAGAQAAWLSDAKKLEGDVYKAQGVEKQNKGDADGAMADFEKAGAAYRAGAEISRSDPTIPVADVERCISMLEVDKSRGRPVEIFYDQALASLARAHALNPDASDTFTVESRCHWRMAEYLRGQGTDPTPTLDKAIAAADAAVERDPRNSVAYGYRGIAWANKGLYQAARGGNPIEAYDQAIASCRKATELKPNDDNTLNSLGIFFINKWRYDAGKGRATREPYEQAVASYERAAQVNPESFTAYNNLGIAHLDYAKFEIEHGRDASPYFEKSFSGFRRVLELNPKLAASYNNLANVFLGRGDAEAFVGRDPLPAYDEGIATVRKALELNPKYAIGHSTLGILLSHRARARLESGADPSPDLAAARAALDQSLAVKADLVDSYIERCRIDTLAARWAMRAGGTPDGLFTAAEAALTKCIEINANNAEAHRVGAELFRRKAEWSAQTGKSGAGELAARGISLVERSLVLKPEDAEALALHGALLIQQAKAVSGSDARKDGVRRAVAVLERAMTMNRFLARDCDPMLAEARKLL